MWHVRGKSLRDLPILRLILKLVWRRLKLQFIELVIIRRQFLKLLLQRRRIERRTRPIGIRLLLATSQNHHLLFMGAHNHRIEHDYAD